MYHTVLGLFDHVDDTAKTVTPLTENLSKSTSDIRLLSVAAYPHGTLFKDHTPLPLWKFALVGGILGFIIGVLLAGGTQILMNLNVGGKDPFSLPTVAVITYEITLLGAIVGTLLGMLFMQGLPDWTDLAYDPMISHGKVGLLVRCVDESDAAKVEELMLWYGAKKISYGKDNF
jgi:hypothetical protein